MSRKNKQSERASTTIAYTQEKNIRSQFDISSLIASASPNSKFNTPNSTPNMSSLKDLMSSTGLSAKVVKMKYNRYYSASSHLLSII